jgi:hypothetical protein
MTTDVAFWQHGLGSAQRPVIALKPCTAAIYVPFLGFIEPSGTTVASKRNQHQARRKSRRDRFMPRGLNRRNLINAAEQQAVDGKKLQKAAGGEERR